MGNQKHQKSSCRAYGLIFVKIRAKYGHFLGKNTGIITAKFRFLWFSRLFAIYCTFSESLLYHKLVWCFVLPHSSSFLRFRAGFHPQPEAPPANIFRRFSAKILHISENFCQKFCVKFYPKKRVITTFATKKHVNATFATKQMRNCSINRFTTQIIASVKGKAWFFN